MTGSAVAGTGANPGIASDAVGELISLSGEDPTPEEERSHRPAGRDQGGPQVGDQPREDGEADELDHVVHRVEVEGPSVLGGQDLPGIEDRGEVEPGLEEQ